MGKKRKKGKKRKIGFRVEDVAPPTVRGDRSATIVLQLVIEPSLGEKR